VFIIETLKHYAFGPELIQWISSVMKNLTSYVSNNGFTLSPIQLLRGARQGDPLSGILFIIVINILIQKTEQNPGIDGVRIKHETLLTVGFADDLTFFPSSLEGVGLILQEIEKFSKVSTLEINVQKSEVAPMGGISARKFSGFGLKWTDLETSSLKILGVHFSYN
jgi:hypothetical protein